MDPIKEFKIGLDRIERRGAFEAEHGDSDAWFAAQKRDGVPDSSAKKLWVKLANSAMERKRSAEKDRDDAFARGLLFAINNR